MVFSSGKQVPVCRRGAKTYTCSFNPPATGYGDHQAPEAGPCISVPPELGCSLMPLAELNYLAAFFKMGGLLADLAGTISCLHGSKRG